MKNKKVKEPELCNVIWEHMTVSCLFRCRRRKPVPSQLIGAFSGFVSMGCLTMSIQSVHAWIDISRTLNLYLYALDHEPTLPPSLQVHHAFPTPRSYCTNYSEFGLLSKKYCSGFVAGHVPQHHLCENVEHAPVRPLWGHPKKSCS